MCLKMFQVAQKSSEHLDALHVIVLMHSRVFICLDAASLWKMNTNRGRHIKHRLNQNPTKFLWQLC